MPADPRHMPMLATATRPLPKSGMSTPSSNDAPPEPRPGRDLEGQRILDRLRNSLFGVDTGPTRVGRWHILRRLGKGAMGLVYEAHDPELDRRVAVKVLHSIPPEAEQARRIRLRREAQAMARVKHPNLVEVYDVSPDAPQPFVVMELIEGEPLRTWQEREGRTWRELVAAYLEAARGLAALHDARLVHRDFKPDNALVDREGRVRVVDFSLVYADAPDPVDADPPGPFSADLTRAGALVGTPAYMSPEQLRGMRGDARSDQFSLCRALYEAVYQARPFVGNDIESVLEDMRTSRPPMRPNPLHAPRWLGAVILRGLAMAPERRFPSMHALADALSRGLAGTRRWVVLGGALLLVAGTLGGLLGRQTHPCDIVEDELIGAWDLKQDAAIRAGVLTQGAPRAEAAVSHLSRVVSQLRPRWVGMRRDTCEALEHATPEPWALHRAQCLEETRLLLRNLARTYDGATPPELEHARAAATALNNQLAECERINPVNPGPRAPGLPRRIEAALAEAKAEQTVGRLVRAESAARRALDAATEAGHATARAEALHWLGRILGHRLRPDEALAALQAASDEATAAGHDRVRVEARLFSAKIRLLDFGERDNLNTELTDLDAFILRLEREGHDVRRLRAERHEILGFAATQRGDSAEAVAQFSEALRFYSPPGVDRSLSLSCPSPAPPLTIDLPTNLDVDAVRTLNNLALAMDDGPTARTCAEQLYRTALAASNEFLGELHPVGIEIRFDFAETLRQQARDPEALDILRPVLSESVLQYGEDSLPAAKALLVLGTIAVDRGSIASGTRWLESSADLMAHHCTERGCPPNYGVALLALGETAARSGQLARAIAFYEAAIAELARQPWAADQARDVMTYLAEALDESGRHDEADQWRARAKAPPLAPGGGEQALLPRRLDTSTDAEKKNAPADRE